METRSRPLAPHLQVYKPQLTSVLSILHRITGLALSLGFLVLVYWLASLAGGPQAYADAVALLSSLPGRLALFAWTYCFFYHLCNGLRHLAWDAGLGFELPQVYASGWAVVIVSVALTLLAWGATWLGAGGGA